MQLQFLHRKYDALQIRHGEASLHAIPGAGCTRHPRAMFVFMNPTARNVSAQRDWTGLRAPWLGTRNVWKLFHALGLVSPSSLRNVRELAPGEWTPSFASALYAELEKQKVYVTNFAKCTQADSRPLSDRIFRDYAELLHREIAHLRPQSIISFGNQVSSLLLAKSVSVSAYTGVRFEPLHIQGDLYRVYPTYYPVGQGQRNMPLAIRRIKAIIKPIRELKP